MTESLDIPTKQEAIIQTEALVGYIDTRMMLIESLRRASKQNKRLHFLNIIVGLFTGIFVGEIIKAYAGNYTNNIAVAMTCLGVAAFGLGFGKMILNMRLISRNWIAIDKTFEPEMDGT